MIKICPLDQHSCRLLFCEDECRQVYFSEWMRRIFADQVGPTWYEWLEPREDG